MANNGLIPPPPEEELFGANTFMPIKPTAGLPPVPSEEDLFPRQPGPEEPYELRRSIAGNVASGILPSAFNMVHEAIAVPARTVYGIGDAYNELRAGKTPPNKLTAAIGSPLQSYLNASTRNVPEDERNAAKTQTVASTLGGGMGMGAGAITGAALGSVVPVIGTAAGGVVGGLVGGLGGSLLGNRYGREKLQEAGLTPEGDQWEEDKRDISDGIIGSLLMPVGSTYKSYKGNKASRKIAAAGEAMDSIYRGTNPGALQTQALAGSSKDTVFRAPRGNDFEPFNPPKGPLPVEGITTNKPGKISVAGYEESLQGDVEVVTPDPEKLGHSNSIKAGMGEDWTNSNPENLPAISPSRSVYREPGSAPALYTPKDLQLPEADVPALYSPNELEIPSEQRMSMAKDASGREAPVFLPKKKDRVPGQYYLDEALNEPGMDMVYDRSNRGSEFDTIAPYAKERIIAGKQKVNKVFSELPEEARIPVGKAVFGNVDKLLDQSGVPQGARTPFYDVWYSERGGLAPLFLGGDDSSPHIQEYRRLLNKQKSSERGGAREVGDTGQFREKLTPEERKKLNAFDAQIDNYELTFAEADKLKTHFAELASRKYEKGGHLGSDDKANRALVHQAMADSLRNQIESGVNYYAPDKVKEFQAGNRESQIYYTVEKLAKQRAADDKFYGRNKIVDENNRPPSDPTMWGSLQRMGKALKDNFIPDPQSREQMLKQADATPFNGGTGFGMFGAPEWSNRFFQTSEKINKAIQGYQGATTTRGEVPNIFGDPIRKNRIKDANPMNFQPGIEGIQAGRAAARDNNTGYEILDETVGPYIENKVQNLYSNEPREKIPPVVPPGAIDKLSSVLGAINPFQANTAMAEELPQKLPRNSQDFTSDKLADFLMQTSSDPTKAPIAQQLVAKLQQAVQAQDMDKVERLHSDMARVFPDLFEQGTGVNGKVFYPDEQMKVMENLRQLHRQGQIDSIQLAKQRNAFMNPMDSRILPVDRKPQMQSSGPNQMVNGTRQYAY